MKKTKMKTHWVADLYPLKEEDIDALAADIAENGQVEPIRQLKDGSIIDGRNRWLACEKAGIEAKVIIVDEDDEEFTDERAFALATSCNSMRRDISTSMRACLAAAAWRRLHPEGEGLNKGGRGKKTDPKTRDGFFVFAKEKFKVGKTYAEQALAIANYNGDLFEEAKTDLPAAYNRYLSAKKADAERKAKIERVGRHKDLQTLVDDGSLSLDDAIAAAEKRDREDIERKEAEKRDRQRVAEQVLNAANFAASAHSIDEAYIAAAVRDFGGKPLSEKPIWELLAAAAESFKKTAELLK